MTSSLVGILLDVYVQLKSTDRLYLNLDMSIRNANGIIIGKVQRNFIRNAVHAIVGGRVMYLVPSYRYSPVFIVCEVEYEKT